MARSLYKVLNENGIPHHGGRGKWPLPTGDAPGEWLEVGGGLVPCRRGLHLCRKNDLVHWLGPAIFVAEYEGEKIVHGNKIVVGRARLVKRLETWNERTARLFAADCAERALKRAKVTDKRSWRAVEVARLFAVGEATKDELNAASDAAWDAARGAARGAASDAASDAVWDAAWDAASDAAWDAASDAARGAMRGAAWDAERKWQTKRLFEYLNGKRT